MRSKFNMIFWAFTVIFLTFAHPVVAQELGAGGCFSVHHLLLGAEGRVAAQSEGGMTILLAISQFETTTDTFGLTKRHFEFNMNLGYPLFVSQVRLRPYLGVGMRLYNYSIGVFRFNETSQHFNAGLELGSALIDPLRWFVDLRFALARQVAHPYLGLGIYLDLKKIGHRDENDLPPF